MGISFKETFLTVVSIPLLLWSCRQNSGGTEIPLSGEKVNMEYSKLLEMEDYDDFTVVRITNPWDTTSILKTYLLTEKKRDGLIDSFPDAKIIEVPVRNAVVFSAVHNSLINELGHLEIVKGVCDASYIFEDWLKERLASGETLDCGSNFQPNIEKIVSISPDAVLLSPYEDMNNSSKLEKTGIPIVDCAEYMEETPLGRAEWMKFYGRLIGEREKADSLFASTRNSYNSIKEKAIQSSSRPLVLFDRPYRGVWYVPSGNSNVGILIEDAGGRNPFKNIAETGSKGLDIEQVLSEAGDADVWLIRHDVPILSYSTLSKEKKAFEHIKAFKNKKIWETNTTKSHIFEEMSFHPQLILKEYTMIFHPECSENDQERRYFNVLMQ